ncbi:MAG: prolyl oligopeptidase family serine peptidase [Phycisphaerales bacterium]|nr:prolyl oligopeptidase family serine peptidase [Phycisphaerales bacterium]
MTTSHRPFAAAVWLLRCGIAAILVGAFAPAPAQSDPSARQPAPDTQPPAAAAAADPSITLRVHDRDRRALVVNAPAQGARQPAVIVLHGGMASAAQMRATCGFDAVARANGFTVVYPDGTEFRDGRRAWNTGHLLRRQVRDADDIAFLDALIDRLIAEHGADPARIFLTGGSNGGMMTFVYAVARPHRLAAAAPVVASMFTLDTAPAVPLPILIVNGGKDEEVPLAGGMSGNALVRGAQATPFQPVRDVVAFWVKANRSRPAGETTVDGTVTTTTYAAGPDGAVTEFVLDSAGGHGWPGRPSHRTDNTPIVAFEGAERVWRFFADKARAPAKAPEPAQDADPKRAADPTAAAPTRPAAPAASNDAPAAGGVAAAPLAVEVVAFPDLVDDSRRGPPSAEAERPRRLLRRRAEAAPASGRAVPIKAHAPTAGGPYPVIVLSHGAGGDWDTHFAQAQDLAAHGYVVLCLQHVGSDRERLTQGLRPLQNLDAMIRDADEVLARPKDVGFALDMAKRWNDAHATLRGKLDLQHVGAMGHSFGAFTTMVVCGMRPALDWLAPAVAPGVGLGPDLRDARVRCGVALSPQGVGEPFFLADSFASLRAPLLGVSGSADAQQAGQPATNRRDAFALWPKGPHAFVWLSNAAHLDFTDSTGTDRRAQPSPSRADVQPIARAATRAFFDLHLKGDEAARSRLTVAGLSPLLRGVVDRVEVLTK